MGENNQEIMRYECVEPDLGNQLWKLETPGTDPDLEERLRAHLAICDACRLEHQFEHLVATALRSGEVTLGRANHEVREHADAGDHVLAPIRRLAAGLLWGGAALAAVSVLLIFLLAPTPLEPAGIARSGGAQAQFLRPLESEVVGSVSPELSWTPVQDATSYLLTLEAIRGSYRWMAETKATHATPPQEHELPPNSRFRATVETVPRDLLPLGGMSVTFHTGGSLEYISYRMAAAPAPLQATTAGGVLIALGGLVWRIRSRRREDPAGA